MTNTVVSRKGKKNMPECICCKKNHGNIKVSTHVSFYICGQSNCESAKGQDISEWFLEEDLEHRSGNYRCYIGDVTTIEFHIGTKTYKLPNDKRVLKGLKNKLREFTLKTHGIQADNTD